MAALLVFIIATFGVFGTKKLLEAKDPSGDNVFKTPARFKLSLLYLKLPIIGPPTYKPPPPYL